MYPVQEIFSKLVLSQGVDLGAPRTARIQHGPRGAIYMEKYLGKQNMFRQTPLVTLSSTLALVAHG